MQIENQSGITLFARVTGQEPGLLDAYRVGTQNATIMALPGDEVVCVEPRINSNYQANWELELYAGARFSYTDVDGSGSPTVTSDYLRNADGRVIYLRKIYAILVQHIQQYNVTDPEDIETAQSAGWLVELTNVQRHGDSVPTFTDLSPNPSGYLDGPGCFYAQVFPTAIALKNTTRLTLDALGEIDEVHFKIVIIGQAAVPTVWADAVVYATGDLVFLEAENTHDYRQLYRCISGHTAATATNKPASGSSWATYWVAAQQ